MASNICQRLYKKVWKSYPDELHKAPKAGGIYVIGNASGKVLYLGEGNIHDRLRNHKNGKNGQKQVISKFVKDQFKKNRGRNLRIKWVLEENHKCLEGYYVDCMATKLGYWPRFNKKGGNKC